jgi:hypothetical protein
MCIDCRLDLWRGSEGAASGQRRGLPGLFAGPPVGYHGVGGQHLSLGQFGKEARDSTAPVVWPRQACAPEFDLHPKTVPFIMMYP